MSSLPQIKKNGFSSTQQGFHKQQQSSNKQIQRPLSQLTSKSTANISVNQLLHISPTEVVLHDIQINRVYETLVIVKNLSKHSVRIRALQPQSSKFKCDFDMQGAIAPGLAMKFLIQFETDSLGDFYDNIWILSENNFKQQIKLSAMQPKALLKFENLINFGYIDLEKEKVKVLKITNTGMKPGSIELIQSSKQSVNIKPAQFYLKEGEEQDVKVTFMADNEKKVHREIIQIVVNGVTQQQSIDIHATSVPFQWFILNQDGQQIQSLDFGSIHYGNHKSLTAYLVNNTPIKQKFQSHLIQGTFDPEISIQNFQTPYELGVEEQSKTIKCEPKHGFIQPFSRVQLKFHCQSNVTDKEKVWTKNFAISQQAMTQVVEEYDTTAVFTFEGFEEKTILKVAGRGICPQLRVEQTQLDFGDCPISQRRDIVVTVENQCSDNPIEFNFSKIPFFFVSPQQMTLAPQQKNTLIFSFKPQSFGIFRQVIQLLMVNGQYKVPISLKAVCLEKINKTQQNRGPETSIKDFESDYVFVEERVRPYTQANPNPDGLFLTSYEEQDQLVSAQDSIKLDNFVQVKQNKDIYNGFLQQQQQQRKQMKKNQIIEQKVKELTLKQQELEKKKPRKKQDSQTSNLDFEDDGNEAPIDYEFQFGLDNKGLSIPKPQVTTKKDNLFVLKPIGAFDPSVEQQQQAFHPDPKVPAKKVFNSVPKSHAEANEQLLQIY